MWCISHRHRPYIRRVELLLSVYPAILLYITTNKGQTMNPFTYMIDWLDENADYAPIGAFIGVGIAIALCFIFGGN